MLQKEGGHQDGRAQQTGGRGGKGDDGGTGAQSLPDGFPKEEREEAAAGREQRGDDGEEDGQFSGADHVQTEGRQRGGYRREAADVCGFQPLCGQIGSCIRHSLEPVRTLFSEDGRLNGAAGSGIIIRKKYQIANRDGHFSALFTKLSQTAWLGEEPRPAFFPSGGQNGPKTGKPKTKMLKHIDRIKKLGIMKFSFCICATTSFFHSKGYTDEVTADHEGAPLRGQVSVLPVK